MTSWILISPHYCDHSGIQAAKLIVIYSL